MERNTQPVWFWELLEGHPKSQSEFLESHPTWRVTNGIPRSPKVSSAVQQQTSEAFGFKWEKRDTFEEFSRTFTPNWLSEKYGSFATLDFLNDHGLTPVVLDAGCGAGMSGLAFFNSRLNETRLIGVDISNSVDVAAERFTEAGHQVGLIQCDLNEIPIQPETVDVIFSEGVLHHTDNTFDSLRALATLLRPAGRILFYVYKVKGPIREFTDDFIRDRLKSLSLEEAWNQLLPLTKLGISLGELNATVEIAEDIPLLGIAAGPVNVQRLFYWHVLKTFYRPDITLEEMNHINFDWFVPANARRHSPQEVRDWCRILELEIERELIEDAGITIVARRSR